VRASREILRAARQAQAQTDQDRPGRREERVESRPRRAFEGRRHRREDRSVERERRTREPHREEAQTASRSEEPRREEARREQTGREDLRREDLRREDLRREEPQREEARAQAPLGEEQPAPVAADGVALNREESSLLTPERRYASSRGRRGRRGGRGRDRRAHETPRNAQETAPEAQETQPEPTREQVPERRVISPRVISVRMPAPEAEKPSPEPAPSAILETHDTAQEDSPDGFAARRRRRNFRGPQRKK
jgi:hypothetical protein